MAKPEVLAKSQTQPGARKVENPKKPSCSVLAQKTGIQGLDEVLNGGIPKYSLTLLAGTSGTGKTILSFQWLFEGVKEGDNGIYISITEPLFMALRNIESLGFYDRSAIEQQKLKLFDIQAGLEYGNIDPQSLLHLIEKQIKEANAKRVVIDSISGILYAINDPVKITNFMFGLKNVLASLGCTSIMIGKVTETGRYSSHAIEELVPDGVIALSNLIGENKIIRTLQVIKMRGIDFRTGAVVFEITPSGIVAYPKIPVNPSIASTDFNIKVSSGIKELDNLCDGGQGGFPQGHVIMVAGNTGSGKTTFGLQFLMAGLERGEAGVYVALEESASQIRKTAQAHGWGLEKYENNGKLLFINPSLIDLNPDKLLYEIVRTVDDIGAKRLVLDSVSSLESMAMNKNKVRQVLIQISGIMKTKGTTCMLTYLSENAFGADLGQLIGGGPSSELRLSSITDAIILLRYVERGQSVAKLLNILKMRGSAHDKKIWKFEIGKDGVKLGPVFQD